MSRLSITPRFSSIINQQQSVTHSNTVSDTTPQNSVPNRHNTSRSLMKLQLQKQQAEAEERRLAANAMSHCSQSSMFSTSMNGAMPVATQGDQFSGSFVLNNAAASATGVASSSPIAHQSPMNSLSNTMTASEIIPRDVLSQVLKVSF